MNKLVWVVALGLSAINMSAQAAAVGQAFNVTATLSAQCVTNNATPSAVDFGTYTAFGSATNPSPTTDISFKCTRGVTITGVALDSAAGSISGLAYTLGIGADVPTAQAAPLPNIHSYTITGTMAAGQAGDANPALVGPVVHTLTITY